jgi:hypothetical protein
MYFLSDVLNVQKKASGECQIKQKKMKNKNEKPFFLVREKKSVF